MIARALMLCLFCVTSLATTTLQAGSFILSAEGTGETLEEAKIAAVAELGKSIIARVESSFSSEVSVSNDIVNREAQSKKEIKSDQLLKGVQYAGERRDSEGVHITAGLDQQGVNDTVEFMRKQLGGDLSVQSRQQLQALLKTVDHMHAFVTTVPKVALSAFPGLDKWVDERRHEILQRLNQGRVEFISSVEPYEVSVDGKPVVSGTYFPVGNYEFEASAEGFRSFRGSFNISQSGIVKVRLPFVKVFDNKTVDLQIDENFEFLKEGLVDIFEDMGVTTGSGARQVVKISLSDSPREVDGYISHRYKISIVAEKDGQRVNRVRLKKSLTAEVGDDQKIQTTLSPLVGKAVIALFSRMDVDAYFE